MINTIRSHILEFHINRILVLLNDSLINKIFFYYYKVCRFHDETFFGYLSGRDHSPEVVLLLDSCVVRVTINSICAMADNQTSADDAGAEIEFADPLGVKDPVGCDVNDDGDGVVSFPYLHKYVETVSIGQTYCINWIFPRPRSRT